MFAVAGCKRVSGFVGHSLCALLGAASGVVAAVLPSAFVVYETVKARLAADMHRVARLYNRRCHNSSFACAFSWSIWSKTKRT